MDMNRQGIQDSRMSFITGIDTILHEIILDDMDNEEQKQIHAELYMREKTENRESTRVECRAYASQ